jgi:hypothetical protein
VTHVECPRESDVLDAVASARWPHRVPRELADHVSACQVCADVVTVAEAMRADHDAVWQADIPSSGQVWWRAEMRARQEAIRKASRPITIAQGAAALLTLAAAVATGWFAWTWIRLQTPALDLASLSAQAMTSPLAVSLVVALCALAVIAPVALYLVLSDE